MFKAGAGGVLSVDLLLAARERGFEARLVEGDAAIVRDSVLAGRPAILMIRIAHAPLIGRDLHHFIVADGFDEERGLNRVQFGDGKVRWIGLAKIESAWAADGHALLLVAPRRAPGGAAEARLDRAVTLERAGQLDQALALYRGIVRDEPDWPLAWTNLGNAESAAGVRAAAEAAYRRAILLEPADRDALNNLAWLLLQEGARLEEAEALARRAVAAAPEDPAARDTLERILAARRD